MSSPGEVFEGFISSSRHIAAVRDQLARLLDRQTDARRLPPILIQGETGTGKGLLARIIHRRGPRSSGPFVEVNCAAIPDTLLEAELFGFERGAFTDARQAKPGLFQTAARGCLFLDEVGLLPEALQAKLLKVIEERVVRRLGSTRTEPVDAWVIAASNEDLAAAVRERRFREDLYHRLAVLTLRLPPLRERSEDILALAEHFLTRACADYGLPARALSEDARAMLLAYPWPGNVRELSNVIERVALLSETPTVTASLLGLAPQAAPPAGPVATPAAPRTLEDVVESAERAHLLEILRETTWNVTRAAQRLGVSRNTLRYRMEKYGLRREGDAEVAPRPAPTLPPVAVSAAAPSPAPPVASTPAVPARPAPGSPLRWERHRLTLLRAEADSAPAHGAAQGLAPLVEALVDKVQTFGGRVEEMSPHGVVAVFGLDPVEDAPRRGAHAAMAILKAAERLAESRDTRPGIRLALHVAELLVGRASGPVTVDQEGKRAAWERLDALMGLAGGGEITVSAAAAPFLVRRFELTPVEGAGDRAYRIAGWDLTGTGPRRAPFVGRRFDLELLHDRLRRSMEGRGQFVGIAGEAGIGKSRLVAEFRQRLAGEPVTYCEGRCLSFGASMPYLPIVDIVRDSCGIGETDSGAAVGDKVRRVLEAVGVDDGSAPYLLHLLGMQEAAQALATLTPEAIKLRTLEALRQVLVHASRQQPLVIVVEDIHWIDKASEELLGSLIESLPGAPILFLATYRPGYRLPWIDRSNAAQMALLPLSPEESLSVVRSVLAPDVPEAMARAILDKGEGNPFFLEELCRAVEEDGGGAAVPAVPDTIQDVLLARIQRLPDDARTLLQAASVLGREASVRLLGSLWDRPESLESALAVLTTHELLYARGEGEEAVYVFQHALTHEVAYAGVAPAARQAMHAAAGRALERLHEGRLPEVYDRLAYHWARTDDARRAVDYLARFAEKSARTHAHEEAVAALGDALARVPQLPEADRDRATIELVLRLPYSLLPLGRVAEIFAALLPERERLERVGDPALSGQYYYLLARGSIFGRHDLAEANARRAIAEAERVGDKLTMGRAYSMLAIAGALSGQAGRGATDGQRAVELLRDDGPSASLCYAYWTLGLCCSQIGAFDEALAAAGRARAIAEQIGDLPLEATAAWVVGVVHAVRGDWDAGIAECRHAAERMRDPMNRAIALGFVGFAHLEKGEAAPAIAALERSVPLLRQFQFKAFEGWFTAFLADAHRLAGRLDRAAALSRDALRITAEARYGVAMGWAQLGAGRIAAAAGDPSGAVTRLEDARAAFEAIGSRYELGRTHLELADLHRALGDAAEAARHLRAAHDLFTALRVPHYRARAEATAAEWGIHPEGGIHPERGDRS